MKHDFYLDIDVLVACKQMITHDLLRDSHSTMMHNMARTINQIIRLIVNLLCCRTLLCYEKHSTKDGIILFLLANTIETIRKDNVELFYRVAETSGEGNYDVVRWTTKYHISLRRFFGAFFFACKLYKDITKRGNYCFRKKLMILNKSIEFYDKKEALVDIVNISKYNLLVVLYDAQMIDNLFVQMFRLNGIKTATLQHGIQLAPRKGYEDNVDFLGTEFLCSVSDYYLAWNDFTKDEAIKAGMNSEKIKVLGVARCIGLPPLNKTDDGKTIGVILDGEYEKENNEPMLRIVEQFSKKHNMNYVLRYHPNFAGNEYDNLISKSARNCPKGQSLYDFLSSVTFCILSNSTVLFELEFFNIAFYRFSYGTDKDKYRDYGVESFDCIEKLENLFIKKDLKTTKNVTKNDYSVFFKEFVCQ